MMVIGHPLPVVSQMRLLGLIIDDRLSWWPLVEDVVKRSKAKIWSLLKLREAGASRDQLLALYIARVRSCVEFGAQVYGAVVNISQSDTIEAVQSKALQIVLGSASRSYAKNLATLGLETLENRRQDLLKSFAISCFRAPEHRWWFTPHPPLPLPTRQVVPRFLVPSCKKDRDEKRPIVVYSQMLNLLSEEEWRKLKLPHPFTSA